MLEHFALSWWTLAVWALGAWLAAPCVYWASRQTCPRQTVYVGSPISWSDFSADGQTLSVRLKDCEEYCYWDTTTGKQRMEPEVAKLNRISPDQITWLPDSRVIVATREKKDEIHVRELTSGRELACIKGRWTTNGLRIQVSPNATTLLTQDDGDWEVYDLSREKLQWTSRSGSSATRPIQYSPNGRVLLNGVHGPIFEVDTGTMVGKFGGGFLEAGQFSCDGHFVANSGRDDTVQLWEFTAWEPCRLLAAYRVPNHCLLSLSRHGKFLATTSWEARKINLPAWLPDPMRNWIERRCQDRTERVVLLDAFTGRRLASLGSAEDARFPTDDNTLATFDRDNGLLKIWDVPPKTVLPAFAPWFVLFTALALTLACCHGFRRRKRPARHSFRQPARGLSEPIA